MKKIIYIIGVAGMMIMLSFCSCGCGNMAAGTEGIEKSGDRSAGEETEESRDRSAGEEAEEGRDGDAGEKTGSADSRGSAGEKNLREARGTAEDMEEEETGSSYADGEYWEDGGYDEEFWFSDDWYEEGYEDGYPYSEDSPPTDPEAYALSTEPGEEGEYLVLKEGEQTLYIRMPSNRTENSYLESEGAFRFEIPHDWIWGSCDLDVRLDSFWEYGDVPCLIWAIDDNNMGENAFSDDWEGVCASVEETAEAVFGGRLTKMRNGKYALEDGQEVYAFWCTFEGEDGEAWTVSSAYRFGKKNMLEFISMNHADGNVNIENLALYTAATYEEYDGERYREYEGEGHYKGMNIWEYKKFHNPFVLAYEQANGEVWRQAVDIPMADDYVVEWKEDILPEALRKVLGMEGQDIRVSDLQKIEYLEAAEEEMEDYFVINEERVSVDWGSLESGDDLVADIANLKNLTSLSLQIGNISDFSPIGELKLLEELNIEAGRTVTDISFLDELENLWRINLEKARQQIYIDSLDGDLWERTCRELEYTTFSKEYDGESGKAFDGLDLSEYME